MIRSLAVALCFSCILLGGIVPAVYPQTYSHSNFDPTTTGIGLTGRVVTPDGQPVVKVNVHITVKSPYTFNDANNGIPPTQTVQLSARDVKTDDQGYYRTGGIKPGDTVIIFVNEAGYQYISGGTLAAGNGGYVASDMVTAPPIASISGVVTDPNGAPVVGGIVIAPDSNPDSSTSTDATGHFTLTGLPAGQTELIAVGVQGVYRGSCRTGANVALTLQPVPSSDGQDISNATSVLTGAYKQAVAAQYKAADRMVLDLAGFDPAGAVQLASLNGATPADTTLYAIALAVARANPTRAVVVAPDIVSKIVAPGPRAIAASYVGLYLVAYDKDTARRLLDIAKSAVANSSFETYGGSDRVAVATLAYKLGDRGGMKLLDDTIKDLHNVVAKLGRDSKNDVSSDILNTTLAAYAETVAPAGSEMIEHVLSQIAAPNGGLDPRLIPRTKAIETLAEFDAPDALGMLQKYDPHDVGAPVFGEAACEVIEQLGKTDAAGALSLAQMVTDQQHVPVALALAARVQTPDAAAPLFQSALTAALRDTQKSATSGWVAAQAWEMDPALGKVLFSTAYTQLTSASTLSGGLAPFLFYYYRVDPIESRAQAECDFARAALAERITDVSNAMMISAIALASMDTNRAIELANTIPGTLRYETLRKIAQYMLATPAVKRTLRFERWEQPDGWIPGRPTGL